nr:golgin subfamily A member 6-like protein 22 [Onthophagus taurus]
MDEKPEASDGPAGQTVSRATHGEGSTPRDYTDYCIQGSASQSIEGYVFRRSTLIGRSPTRSAERKEEASSSQGNTEKELTPSEESEEPDTDLDQTFVSAEELETKTSVGEKMIDLVSPEKSKQYNQLVFPSLDDLEENTPLRVRSWSLDGGVLRQMSMEEETNRESKKRKMVQRGSEEEREEVEEDTSMEGGIKMPTKKTNRERMEESLKNKEQRRVQTEIKTNITEEQQKINKRGSEDEKREVDKIDREKEEQEIRKRAKKVDNSIEEMLNLVKVLRKHTEQNTKREIKDTVRKMERLAVVLGTKELLTYEGTRIKPGDVKEMKTQATQTEREKDSDERERKERMEKIRNARSFKEWEQVVELEWEEGNYEVTKIIEGNPVWQQEIDTRVVMIEPEDIEMERGIQRQYKKAYPILEELKEECEDVEMRKTMKVRGEKREIRERIIKIRTGRTEKEIWQTLITIRKKSEGEREIAMHHITGITLKKLRTMTDIIFKTSKTTVKIYTTLARRQEEEKDKRGRALKEGSEGKKSERATYALILQSEGPQRTYEEMVKDIKIQMKGRKETDGRGGTSD